MIPAADLLQIERGLLIARLKVLGWRELAKRPYFADPVGRLFMVPDKITSDLDLVALRAVVDHLLGLEGLHTISDLQSRLRGRKEDILFFGSEVAGVPAGRLPMKNASRFYELATQYFRATVKALVARREGTSSQTIFDRLQYGTGSEGSYMVSVHVPVDPLPNPIGRELVVESINAFTSLAVAVDRSSSDVLLAGSDPLWTPSMCEALLKFTENSMFTELKLRAAPDPAWSSGPDIARGEVIVELVDSPAPAVLAEAAARLRGLKETQYVEIVGIPFQLRDDTVIGEGDKRTMSIQWRRPNASPVKVQVKLSPAAYETALEAISKRQIQVSGWLRQEGSRWVMEVDGLPNLMDAVIAPETVAKVLSDLESSE